MCHHSIVQAIGPQTHAAPVSYMVFGMLQIANVLLVDVDGNRTRPEWADAYLAEVAGKPIAIPQFHGLVLRWRGGNKLQFHRVFSCGRLCGRGGAECAVFSLPLFTDTSYSGVREVVLASLWLGGDQRFTKIIKLYSRWLEHRGRGPFQTGQRVTIARPDDVSLELRSAVVMATGRDLVVVQYQNCKGGPARDSTPELMSTRNVADRAVVHGAEKRAFEP